MTITTVPLRRRAATFLATAIVAGALVAVPTAAHAAPAVIDIGGVRYNYNDANIAAGASAAAAPPGWTSGNALTLPATISAGGHTIPVTSIAPAGFQSTVLGAVTIPSSVKTIGASAFYGASMPSLDLGTGVATIGEDAFNATSGGYALTIPSSVTTIGARGFMMAHFSSLVLNEGLMEAGDNAFLQATINGALTLPDSLVDLGPSAFDGAGITAITFGSGLVYISDGGFQSNQLLSVTLPYGIRFVGANAFAFNGNLSSVTIPPGIDTIGSQAFGNTNLTDVRFDGFTPATFSALGSGDSLGTQPGLVISYDYQFDSSQFSGGFTTPLWQGYASYPRFTVDFDARGVITDPATQPIANGDTVTEPVVVAPAHYAFLGWFTDSDATVPFDFTSPPTTSLTLYAGWDPDEVTVTFDANGFSTAPADQVIDYNSSPTNIAPAAVDGYTFQGWYLDPAGHTPYLFTTPVTGDLTLYAYWTENFDLVITAAAASGTPGTDTWIENGVLHVRQGGTLAFSAELHGGSGSIATVPSADFEFSSSVATDVVNGNLITFPHASPHTITALYVAGDGGTATLLIEVVPTPLVPPAPPAALALAATGSDNDPGTARLAALMLVLGLPLVMFSRRRRNGFNSFIR